jgi:hypothetical protein
MDNPTHDTDHSPETHTIQLDWSTEETPSHAVVSLVADAKDVRPIDLTPLHETVDPDALDRLFAPTTGGSRTDGYIAFVFEGYHVTVHGDGEVIAKAGPYDR